MSCSVKSGLEVHSASALLLCLLLALLQTEAHGHNIVRKEERSHAIVASDKNVASALKPIKGTDTLGDDRSSSDKVDSDADGDGEIPQSLPKQEAATSPTKHEEDLSPASLGKNMANGAEQQAGMMIVNGKTAETMDVNRCLSTDGSALFMEDCYRGTRLEVPYRQKWFWSGRRLRNREHGVCVAMPYNEVEVHGHKKNMQLTVQPCSESVQQVWFFDDFSRLKTRYQGDHCMDTEREYNTVFLRVCDSRPTQWFSYY